MKLALIVDFVLVFCITAGLLLSFSNQGLFSLVFGFLVGFIYILVEIIIAEIIKFFA